MKNYSPIYIKATLHPFNTKVDYFLIKYSIVFLPFFKFSHLLQLKQTLKNTKTHLIYLY